MFASGQWVFENGRSLTPSMQRAEARILILDDDPDVLTAARVCLKRRFTTVVTANDPALVSRLTETESAFDVVLLDLNFRRGDQGGAEGLSWIERLLQIDPELSIVCMTAFASVELAVEAVRLGAVDFVTKPWENAKLEATVSAALRLRRSRAEAADLRGRARELGQPSRATRLTTLSPAFAEVVEHARLAAPTGAHVLLVGEVGTGRETLAREMHRLSNRAAEAFVAVDLAALAPSEIEDEMFGQASMSASTGERIGRIAAADGGTLYVSGLDDAPPAIQGRMAGLIEHGALRPLGADRSRAVDVRVIGAATAEPDAPVRLGPDLLHRLPLEIRLPPLRDRREDIGDLADKFAVEFARRHGRALKPIERAARAALEGYEWPGNIRALRNSVERAVILSRAETLSLADFGLPDPTTSGVGRGVRGSLEKVERKAIVQALKRHDGNVSQAAAELGLTRGSLYRRLSKHGL